MRSRSVQSAGSTQLWKKSRLSFGRSSSVGGGVRKLGLLVAGTGDGFPLEQEYEALAVVCLVASLQALVGYFEEEILEKNEPSYL